MTAVTITSSSQNTNENSAHHHHIDIAMLDTIRDGEAFALEDSHKDLDNTQHIDTSIEGGHIKRSNSVGGATLATMATECSIFSDMDKTQKDDMDEEQVGVDIDDSLSSHEDQVEGGAGVNSSSTRTESENTNTMSKIPSSLHIPSVQKQAEEKMEEEEEDSTTPTSSENASPEVDDDELTVNASSSNTTKAPRRKSLVVTSYKPTDRSISVAQTPARPLLRRDSSYGNSNEIPLNFNKRRSVLVLPKPDLKPLGRQAREQEARRDRRASAPAAVTSTSKHTKRRSSVQFDKIQIREHVITMGDNPSCSYGTPISLDWDYLDFEELSLEDYEMHKFTSGRGRPRTLRQLYLNHYQRLHRLQQVGFTEAEIKKGKHETNKARKQRDMTRLFAQAKVLVHLEDMVESAGRKVQRGFFFKNKGEKKMTEQEKQLLLKVMEGDDTVDTAQIVRNELNNSQSRDTCLMPISVRSLEG